MVSDLVSLDGHWHERKMMQGSLRAQLGVISGAISQRRISVALRTVAPDAYEARTRDLLERTNPVPYVSPYFGYKCHFDQNEKIGQHYGCTNVAVIDGCSRLVAGFASMPIKNPILIYEFIFRPAILKYGIWDHVRVDHGRQFCYVMFVQQIISYLRADVRRAPFKHTTSTDNNVAERFWPEVNSRINYSVKRAMNGILHSEVDEIFNLGDTVMKKYAVSWVMLYVSHDAIQHLLMSWSYHRVPEPQGCIPIKNMIQTSRTVKVPEYLILTTAEAVKMYEKNGGVLTRDVQFGYDLLGNREDLYESREHMMKSNFPNPGEVFSDIAHNDYRS